MSPEYLQNQARALRDVAERLDEKDIDYEMSENSLTVVDETYSVFKFGEDHFTFLQIQEYDQKSDLTRDEIASKIHRREAINPEKTSDTEYRSMNSPYSPGDEKHIREMIKKI